MRRNLRFIVLLIKLKLQHMMVFRLSFFGAFLTDTIMFVAQLLTYQIIYDQVESIGGWSRGQMIVFVGTFSMLNGLSLVFTYFGIATIPGKIRDGGLDHYLTKPVNPLLRLTFESINPAFIPLLLFSGGVIAYGISTSGISVMLPQALAYTGLLLLMSLLWYDLALILRTIAFFVLSTAAVDRLEDNIFELNFRIPGVLYKGAFKVIFYFILPYGVMSTVPTQLLTSTLTPPGLFQALGIVVVFTAFALWFWRFGLKHYKSASS